MLKLDPQLLGQHSPPKKCEVERGALRKFAQALGLKDPIYYSLEAAQSQGYRDVVAPPTFAVTLLPWEVPGLELPLAGVLHGEQEFHWENPLCAKDIIYVSGWVDEVKSRANPAGKMTMITVSSEGRQSGGELAFTARALLVVTEEDAHA